MGFKISTFPKIGAPVECVTSLTTEEGQNKNSRQRMDTVCLLYVVLWRLNIHRLVFIVSHGTKKLSYPLRGAAAIRSNIFTAFN